MVQDLEVRIARQISNLEREEPDSEAADVIRGRLRELAKMKARRQRELEASELALAGRPDPETAHSLLDLLPLLEVDAQLLERESFRDLLEALSFEARFDPQGKELSVRVVLHPDLVVPTDGSATSVPPTDPPARTGPSVQVRGPERHPFRRRTQRCCAISRLAHAVISEPTLAQHLLHRVRADAHPWHAGAMSYGSEPGQVGKLAEILNETAEAMKRELAGLRSAFTHATTKGEGAEEIVRRFLQSRLPKSIGITSGQVIDSNELVSSQIDVIIYDTLRTPMLFESPHEGQHLVPVEGVIAAIEVKSHLSRAMLESILENCRSVKSLSKLAYFPVERWPIRNAYGQAWVDLPVFYSLFAFESDALYAGHLNDLQAAEQLHNRIDTVCYLDRGVNLNVAVKWSGAEARPSFTATAIPGGGLCDIASDHALLLWYASLSSIVLQGECRPIDLSRYMQEELHVSGTVPQGTLTESMRETAIGSVAESLGIDPGILRKVTSGEGLQLDDVVSVLRGGASLQLPDNAPPEQVALLEVAKYIAGAAERTEGERPPSTT